MSTVKNKLDEAGKGIPFKTPPGYFENLTGEVMSRLPERIQTEPRALSLWDRTKPWVYMAAMFVGIALMVRLYVGHPVQNADLQSKATQEKLAIPASEIDEFYIYYQDQLAGNAYRETLFLEDVSFSDLD